MEEKIPKKTQKQSNKKASRDACAATICINFNLTDGGSGNQFYTTLLTTGKFLPQKHLINISPSSPHFAFPEVNPSSSSSTIDALIKVRCSRCGYPAALPVTPTLMRMDVVWFIPSLFLSSTPSTPSGL